MTDAEFHAANRERAARFPLHMLTTYTHDTKRSPDVRARVCAHLTDLFGISLDAAANGDNCQRISSDTSRVPVLALQTDEEGMIALSTAKILLNGG